MIDLESMTIREARALAQQIAALLPEKAGKPQGADPLMSRFVGLDVVVRSHMSGVWMGHFYSAPGGAAVVLANARRLWRWEGAGSCSGLARRGPKGSGCRITGPVDVAIPEVIEVIAASDEAMGALAAIPEWTGR